MLRSAHRLLGLTLAAPLVLWITTGLLFHIKHRYKEAYEPLKALAPLFDLRLARVSPGDLLEKELVDATPVPRFEVRPDGIAAWFGRKSGVGVAVDAASGQVVAPASEEKASN